MSVVRNEGHNVFFVDNYLKPTDFVKEGFLQKNKIDFVGIYVNTICYRDTLRMLNEIEDFRKGGERIYNLARAFNVREGCRREHDTLPKRLLEEPLADGPAEGLVVDLEPLLDAYYSFRGWDPNTGIPTDEKLTALGLEEIIYPMGAR